MLGPKRIELLRQLVPKAATIALLMNPNNPISADDGKEIQEGGRSVRVEIVNAGTEPELDEAFAKIGQLRADALLVHIDALFNAQDKKIIALAERYAMPTMYPNRQDTQDGGLMCYGTNVDEMGRNSLDAIGPTVDKRRFVSKR
jgi:putative tryptophan/tyrosine transport system substrate-binding protein